MRNQRVPPVMRKPVLMVLHQIHPLVRMRTNYQNLKNQWIMKLFLDSQEIFGWSGHLHFVEENKGPNL